MQAGNQGVAATESSGSNGHTQLHELFALTDEQILEIDREPQDVEVAGVAPAALPANSAERAQTIRPETGTTSEHGARPASSSQEQTQNASASIATLPEPPAWLAETMSDPQRGAEARALWEGAQKAEREVSAYREVFAKPEEARAAAERARVLDEIDRACFTGDATQRAQLAAMMMREDPAAFREMVFEGLRALEESGKPGASRSVAEAFARAGQASQSGNSAADLRAGAHQTPAANLPAHQREDAAQNAHLAAYAQFERAANEDLERSVGSAIERTLEQALPAVGQADGAALKGRMTAAIRQDIEKTLQSDRQLGEQVAQILSARRLDNETRAQVVRLIGERAQQLVPGATRRALNDWTQTTLAAHRGRSARTDAASARREVAPAAPLSRELLSGKEQGAARHARTRDSSASRGRVDYQKLSDEQILEL
jgi:hypothetical protein